MSITFDRWLAVIGIVCSGLLSWIITRYYYRRADKRRTPTFIVQSAKPLANPELWSVDGLRVTLKGNDIGSEGVTEAKIYFWNSGTLPILHNEILEPYTVSFPARVLASSVLKYSRDVVALSTTTTESFPNAVTLDFSVLEPGDGATLRIVYASRKTGIEFKGACLDAPKPRVLTPNAVYLLPRAKRWEPAWIAPLFLALAIVAAGLIAGAVVGAGAGISWSLKKLGEPLSSIVKYVALILVATAIAGMILRAMFNYITAPYLPPDVRDE